MQQPDAQNRESARHAWQSAGILAAVLTLALAQYFVAPFVMPATAATIGGLIALCVFSTPLHWGLMHESIHGNLFRDARLNRIAGRVLGNFLFLSWDVMRFGHLLHHSANRHVLDRPEAIPPGGSWRSTVVPYFMKLLGGHAAISALAPFAMLLPSSIQGRLIARAAPGNEGAPFRIAAMRAIGDPARRWRIRADVVANVVLVAAAFWFWGPYWAVFVLTLTARFCVLSLLDNAPHYGTPVDSGIKARNSQLPRWASLLVLSQNWHGIHHAMPNLRWQQLARAFERSGASYDGSWLATVFNQFRGPVFLDAAAVLKPGL